MLICLIFSLSMMVLVIPGHGEDAHCYGNPNGCSGCKNVSPPCTSYLQIISSGHCTCCKDFDGDEIYHDVQCDWSDENCVINCPSGDPLFPVITTYSPCSVTTNCNVIKPLDECYPVGY